LIIISARVAILEKFLSRLSASVQRVHFQLRVGVFKYQQNFDKDFFRSEMQQFSPTPKGY